jgi:hypothetical protein
MKRFIRSSRKSRENLTARIKSSDAFSRSQGQNRSLRCCPLHDRFSTKNRHSSARIERPFRADFVAKVVDAFREQ